MGVGGGEGAYFILQPSECGRNTGAKLDSSRDLSASYPEHLMV